MTQLLVSVFKSSTFRAILAQTRASSQWSKSELGWQGETQRKYLLTELLLFGSSRTSAGSFHYSVYGHGVPNAYDVFPILGRDVSTGVPFKHPISLKNPGGNEILKMKEIFTTKGEIRMEQR